MVRCQFVFIFTYQHGIHLIKMFTPAVHLGARTTTSTPCHRAESELLQVPQAHVTEELTWTHHTSAITKTLGRS